ncbi:MAG: LysM peptidoglycan-binding domain-containing protein [Clostridia bacterium]|nr:LysM peptidoglycan-binding domain-containing protein [Clostridia bacterium]
MAYTNSKMVVYTKLSPHNSGQRTHSIDRITPHCVVGQCTAETLGEIFCGSREVSANYGIDKTGRVGLYVDEKNRSWCSSSRENDHRAITIECASDTSEPYAFNGTVYAMLVELCVDICRRNGKTKLIWFGDKTKTLNYTPKADEMILTVHRWFASTACPGTWMMNHMADLAKQVTAKLQGGTTAGGTSVPTKPATSVQTLYRVRKTWADSKSQKGAFKELANAKACADKTPGYSVFDANGKAVYTAKTERIYTVVHGDSLWEIARKQLGDGRRYTEIVKLNNLKTNVIYSGQKLKLPEK